MKNKSIFFAGIIGNILDHYDTALLMYLGSVMAPLFFKSDDKIVSLIMFYGVLSLSVISRPLGSLIFSRMANKNGASRALTLSLIGTAISTFLIGLLPIYDSVGIIATILFIVMRFVQTFFGSGEHSVALFFLMENTEENKRSNIGALFNCSTMIGISFASLVSYFVTISSNPEFYWRVAYFCGIITALIGIVIRIITFNPATSLPIIHKNAEGIYFLRVIRNNYKEILVITILYVFSMMTYYIPFVLINDYISIIHTNISKAQLLKHNTIFLYYDLALLILVGGAFKNINYRKIMIITSTSLLISVIPAFYIFQIDSIFLIESIRLMIITIGVLFLSAFQAYIYKICDPQNKYIVHGTGLVIGQDFIGRLTISICLFLWHVSGSAIAPAYYIAFVSFITLAAILLYKIPPRSTSLSQ